MLEDVKDYVCKYCVQGHHGDLVVHDGVIIFRVQYSHQHQAEKLESQCDYTALVVRNNLYVTIILSWNLPSHSINSNNYKKSK